MREKKFLTQFNQYVVSWYEISFPRMKLYTQA
jgi:hypothetical protein